MTKFCKDCKYYKDNRGYALCLHTSSQTHPNLVTGDFYYSSCNDQRFAFGRCTEQAIFFEPKKPLIPPPTSETIRARGYNWFKTFWK